MTPKGRGRAPPSPSAAQGNPRSGVDGIGDRDPDKGVKKKGMVFEATEETMRQAMSCSSRQAAPAIGAHLANFIPSPFSALITNQCRKRPPRPVVATPGLRAHRAMEWDRATPAERNASVGLADAPGPSATTRTARRREMREEGGHGTGDSTAIDRTAWNVGPTMTRLMALAETPKGAPGLVCRAYPSAEQHSTLPERRQRVASDCNSCITPFVPKIYQTGADVAKAVARSKKASVRRPWSKDDMRLLKSVAHKEPAAKIAKTLKRTEGATRQKAKSEGISLSMKSKKRAPAKKR
jgi:hypothetical protein